MIIALTSSSNHRYIEGLRGWPWWDGKVSLLQPGDHSSDVGTTSPFAGVSLLRFNPF